MGGTPWAGMAERRPCWGAVDAVGKSGIAPLKKDPASVLSLQGIFKDNRFANALERGWLVIIAPRARRADIRGSGGVLRRWRKGQNCRRLQRWIQRRTGNNNEAS